MSARDQTGPRRVRWSVPAPETSVREWLDAQSNLSESLRMLVREQIEREGYVDVAYRPVRQLPRRGRPPRDERDEREETTDAEPERDDEPSSLGSRAEGPGADAGPPEPQDPPEPERNGDRPPQRSQNPASERDSHGIPSGLSDFLTS